MTGTSYEDTFWLLESVNVPNRGKLEIIGINAAVGSNIWFRDT